MTKPDIERLEICTRAHILVSDKMFVLVKVYMLQFFATTILLLCYKYVNFDCQDQFIKHKYLSFQFNDHIYIYTHFSHQILEPRSYRINAHFGPNQYPANKQTNKSYHEINPSITHHIRKKKCNFCGDELALTYVKGDANFLLSSDNARPTHLLPRVNPSKGPVGLSFSNSWHSFIGSKCFILCQETLDCTYILMN